MTGDEDNDNDDHNECSEGPVIMYIADTFALCSLSSLVRKVDCPCGQIN